MSPRRASTVSAARRFWLLLWLAPYVFFSVAGDAFHNHLVPNVGHGSAIHESAIHFAQPSADSSDAADALCLICQWQSQSQSGLWTFPTFQTVSRLSQPLETAHTALFSGESLARASIRGPPVA